MATHSSILAWRIPRTEEPGMLQSIGRKESDTTEVTLDACTQAICPRSHSKEATVLDPQVPTGKPCSQAPPKGLLSREGLVGEGCFTQSQTQTRSRLKA